MNMALVTLNSGERFESPFGVSILESAKQAKIFLAYSCKTGRCSSCKRKVLSGVTSPIQFEFGLTEQEKSEGWILTCVRSVESDVVLEGDDLVEVVLPTPKIFPARISQINFLAPDVIQVFLRLPPSADFNFFPGQYVDVIASDSGRRSYSLANTSSTENILELHIRAVEGGAMSQYWFQRAMVDDLLRLSGPFGTFFLRDAKGLDLYFLATGTGFAPVKAILESIALLGDEVSPRSVTVLWGGRTEQDLYMDVARIMDKHSYVPVISRAGGDWGGARGYVQKVLLSMKPDLSNAAIYACGSEAMIREARLSLVAAGLPVNRFYSDAFVCSIPT